MNAADVMDDLADALKAIPKLTVFPYSARKVIPPAAVVLWPTIDYDSTFARGCDQIEVPVVCLAGAVDVRASRNTVTAWAAGSGPQSVKAAIESYTPTAYDSAHVTGAEFGYQTVAEVDLLSVTFTVSIIGKGL